MINVNQITATLAKLPDQSLQQYAMMHKDDPYVVSLALAESNRRKELRGGAQMHAQPQPKVAEQAIAGMAAPMPEHVGIGQLPAGNMNFAGGGIVAFADGGDIPRFSGTAGSFVGPVMSFQQFLASQGVPVSEFVSLTPADQQALRDAYKSTGMGPTAGAAPAAAATPASAAASPPPPEAPGRGYGLGRTAGSLVRGSAPYVAGSEVVGNLGSYKFQEPGLDTSVSGVAKALGQGEFGQAAKNLAMGIPEAGLDVLRAGAGLGDYLLPGQPLSSGLDTLLKKGFGDKIRTPSDAKAVEQALTEPTPASQEIPQTEAAKPVAEKPPAPQTDADRLAELQKQWKSLMGTSGGVGAPSTAGLPGLKPPTAAEAKATASTLVDAAPVLKQFDEFKNQVTTDIAAREKSFLEEQKALPKFGVKEEEMLKKRETELADDKKAAGWMAVIETGLGWMSGNSPFLLSNLGAGGQKGMASYKDSMKDFKKLQSEYDKMRMDIERAKVAEAREDFKARNEFRDRADTRLENVNKLGVQITSDIFQTNSRVAGEIWNNGMREYGATARTIYQEQGQTNRANAQLQQASGLKLLEMAQPTAQEKLYTSLADPNSQIAKGFKNYAEAMGYGDKNSTALLKQYTGILGEQQLRRLEESKDPAERLRGAQIRQRLQEIQGLGGITAFDAPTGNVRP